MTCAEIVKKIRRLYCLDLKEMGKMVGVGKQSIWGYENGVSRPRMKPMKKLIQLAKRKKLKVTVDDFFD